MELQEIKIGSELELLTAWLVICRGIVRGIIVQCEDEVVLRFAFDAKIRTIIGGRTFRDLALATDWLKKRLEPHE